MQTTVSKNNTSYRSFLDCLFFLLLSLLLFWPVLHKSFASDDFSVLYRIIHQRVFFIRDFFRPLSDISLYGSYLIGGFNPFYYNVVNVMIHAGCAFLLYRFCLINNFLTVTNRSFFAWFAALLFLIYPFHNEAVIWAIGRGIVLSGFFGFLSLAVIFLNVKPSRYFLSYLFYFIGLCGYETILLLPFIILIFLHNENKSLRKLLPVAGGYLLTLLINLLIRLLVSGTIWGGYGSKMFSSSPAEYFIKFFKAAGRLFLPPSGMPLFLSICFAAIIACLIILSRYLIKRKDSKSSDYIRISIAVIISCIIPAMFGLSTRTYEGDRVLYFSSFFLCIWIAYLVALLKNIKLQLGASLGITVYFLIFFYQGVFTWKESGSITDNIIKTTSNIKHPGKKLYLLNMPEEYNGAQVFRNGFTEALLINRIDTSGIQVINHIITDKTAASIPLIKPVIVNGNIFVPPYTYVSENNINARRSYNDSTIVNLKNTSAVMIYYWNNQSFILLK